MSKLYFGIYKPPKNKTRATKEQAVLHNQIRNFGLHPVTMDEINKFKVGNEMAKKIAKNKQLKISIDEKLLKASEAYNKALTERPTQKTKVIPKPKPAPKPAPKKTQKPILIIPQETKKLTDSEIKKIKREIDNKDREINMMEYLINKTIDTIKKIKNGTADNQKILYLANLPPETSNNDLIKYEEGIIKINKGNIKLQKYLIENLKNKLPKEEKKLPKEETTQNIDVELNNILKADPYNINGSRLMRGLFVLEREIKNKEKYTPKQIDNIEYMYNEYKDVKEKLDEQEKLKLKNKVSAYIPRMAKSSVSKILQHI